MFPLRSTLEGYYVDDALQGQGLYTYEDGGVLRGTYVDGELNGLAQEFDGEGHLVFKGQYKDNSRCGECWVYHPVSHGTHRARARLLPHLSAGANTLKYHTFKLRANSLTSDPDPPTIFTLPRVFLSFITCVCDSSRTAAVCSGR